MSNRAGLPSIGYRVGTYETFLESMLARLSSGGPAEDDGAASADASPGGKSDAADRPLADLRTRQPDDPSIALLDAWATVADVLTFYQERIANEGYLRTAVERRSILELARLIGYKVRPGVASSTHLAFTMQDGFDVTIDAGTAAKTTPGPGELPQTFEASEPIDARSAWNRMTPRLTRPQRITELNASEIRVIYVEGVATRLKRNDRLLLVFGDERGKQVMRRVAAVQEDHEKKWTEVELQVEEFSAAQLAQDIQVMLADRLRECPELATDPVILALKEAVETSNPILALGQALKTAAEALAARAGGGDETAAQLALVLDPATTLTAGLTALLDAPHGALANNLAVPLDGYGKQQVHAAKIDTALRAFDDTSSSVSVTPRAEALAQADAVLTTETESTADFQAFAAAATQLQEAWSPITGTLDSAASQGLTDANIPINAALAISPAPTGPKDVDALARLKAIHDSVVGLPGTPFEVMIAGLDAANENLKGATANDVPLGALVKKAQDVLKAVVKSVTTELGKADQALDNHASLMLSASAKEAWQSGGRLAQALDTKLPTAALRQQAVLSKQTIADVNAIPAVGLVAKVLDEFAAALTAAPKTVVQDDFEVTLEAAPVPTDLPDGAAKAHASKILGLGQTIRNATNAFDATAKAATATSGIAGEVTAIQQELQAAQEEQQCLSVTVAAFTREQGEFVDHFTQQFQAIGKAYEARIPESASAQLAKDAIQALNDALVPQADPAMAGLVDKVDAAQTAIEALRQKVPVGEAALATWFRELVRDLTQQRDAIAKRQSKPPVVVLDPKDAFQHLEDIAARLLRTAPVGKPAPVDLKTAFGASSDTVARSLQVLKPAVGNELLQGWSNVRVETDPVKVYAFRVAASLFGYNAPTLKATRVSTVEDPVAVNRTAQQTVVVDLGDPDPSTVEAADMVSLDATYDQIGPSSWVAVQHPLSPVTFAKTGRVDPGIGLARYGMSGKTTTISLNAADTEEPVGWFDGTVAFPVVRTTTVWAQAEELTLAEEPIGEPVGPSLSDTTLPGDAIVLNGFFDGLQAGRFVAVTGERTDVPGVKGSELPMIAAVQQSLDTTLPGDTVHTTLVFTVPLTHEYKRDTVTINANVAHATHGELQKEVLGSGDGSQSFQTFKLSKPPLTFLSRPTPSGAESTLEVRVNDILWHESNTLVALGPGDRNYAIDIDDDGVTFVRFGDGIHGGRLPTGRENVRAVYRSGIGNPGNVVATKISVLPSPPLGVTAVTNPSAATGGADPESRDQARRNAPAAVLSLDRLVSVRDYADFARTYAGIAKANASAEAGTVLVTIAGADDIPIDPGSDLFTNLLASIRKFGDPHQRVTLRVRRLKILVLQADISIHPDYEWAIVEAQIRAALLEQFGFDRQELGEPVILSDLIRTIQAVPGVEYIDVEHFGAIPEMEDDKPDPKIIVAAIEALRRPPDHLATAPGEIAYFTPRLAETIVLKRIVAKDRP